MNKIILSLILLVIVNNVLTQPACVEKAKIGEECVPPNCFCGSNDAYFAKLPQFGNLTLAQIPQFVLMSIDDCVNDDYVQIVNAMQKFKRNKNSNQTLPMTFFVWEQWTAFNLVTDFYNLGNEIAIHSMTHSTTITTDIDNWLAEMLESKQVYHDLAGIPNEDMVGWRAPFLAYDAEMWRAIYQAGFQYETSLISYCQPYGYAFNQSTQLWPYTLDNQAVESDYREGIPYQETIPGVMEVPIWGLYDSNANLMGAMDPMFDLQLYINITQKKRTGNKAPFGMFDHLGFFQSNLAGIKNYINDCLKYDDIFFVTFRQLIEWMKNPVPYTQLESQPYMQLKPKIVPPTTKAITCFPNEDQFFTGYWPCPAVNPKLVVNKTYAISFTRHSVGTSNASCSSQTYPTCQVNSTYPQASICFYNNTYWQSYYGSWGMPPSAEWRNAGSCITTLQGGEFQINGQSYKISQYQVLKGNTQTVNIIAYSGYSIDYVLVNGQNMGSISTYTFSNIQSAQSIEVFFKASSNTQTQTTYVISATNSFGCSVSPSSATVQSGLSQTFSIAPDNSSCSIQNLQVDGILKDPQSTYTFSNVVASHTIQPVCVCSYPITVLDSPGCSITPSSANVQNNQNQIFNIAAQANCALSSVTVDGVNQGAVSSYTFSNVLSAHTIGATCTCAQVTQYTVTSSTTGCNMSPLGSQTVNAGSNVQYTITPNSGCSISAITVNGVSQSVTNSLSVNNIQSNTAVVSTCTCPVFYNVVSSTSGCNMSPLGATQVVANGNVQYSISANSGCTITQIQLNSQNQAITNANSMTFNVANVNQDSTLTSVCVCPVIYTVTSSTTGCNMSPLGTVNVQASGSSSYSISANTGCSITSLKLNNVAQTITNSTSMSYVVSNVQKNTTLASTCTCPVVYQVTTSTTGCTMSPLGTTNVTSGGSLSISISSSNSSCAITSLKVGTTSQTISNNQSMTLALTNIVANKAVTSTCTCTSNTTNPCAAYPTWSSSLGGVNGGKTYVDPTNGYAYVSLYWNTLQPMYNNGWKFSTYCNNAPTCAMQWIADAVYNSGDIVKYSVNGVYYKYKASYWNQGTTTPDVNPAFVKQAAC